MPATPTPPPFLLRVLGLAPAGLRHGLRLALAAWLAFALATALGLPNAFWAAMPIWVVAQASRGLLIERGVWRVAGTLLGAAVGFALLRLLPDPVTSVLALATWVGLCGWGMHRVRGVLSYGVMLAGMTASVVMLPALIVPEHATVLALSRVACTLIGVLMVTLVTGLFTPPAPRRDYEAQWAALTREVTAQAGRPHDPARESELLAHLVRLEGQLPLMTAGTLSAHRSRPAIEALLRASIAVLAEWRRLGRRSADAAGRAGRDPVRTRLATALERLAAASRALAAARPDAEAATDRMPAPSPLPGLAAYHDRTRARYAGLLAGGATLAAALLGLLWPGPEGELMALGVCIFSMVLGSLPMPRAVAPKLLTGVAVGVALATAYRLLIQPYADSGLLPLLLTLAPFLMAGGLARASLRPGIALPALDANMCFMLASQAGMPVVGTAAILHGSLALMLAAALTAMVAWVLPEHPRRHAREAMAALNTGIAQLLAHRPPHGTGPDGWTAHGARHTLRLAAYWPHVDAGASSASGTPRGPLAWFNLGQAVQDLQHLAASETTSSPGARAAAQEALVRIQATLGQPAAATAAASHLQGLAEDLPQDESAARLLLQDGARILHEIAATGAPASSPPGTRP
ncbi:FUSC family protein [Comamonadaceae bacterium PP-2]